MVIPTLNRDKYLRGCLISLVHQHFNIDQYEILVIDNGSVDTTKVSTHTIISLFNQHHIRYIYEPEPGLLSGRHRGALEAKGNILVFVDDDIEADPDWLSAICESFYDPLVQLVGGRNLPKYESTPPEWLQYFWVEHPFGQYLGELSLLDFGEQVQEIDANYVWGLNFSIRRQALFDLGGFHPDCIPKHLQHFQGDGETGLTIKANQLGYKAIYQPKALVFHQVPRSRMTYEYFEQRYFYQGVCNSYTKIRELGHLPKVNRFSEIKYLIKSLLKKTKQITFNHRSSKEFILKSHFLKFLELGCRFHQESVRKNPLLLNWILKSDYWDYKLPNITLE
ncbi:glycosyltransferase family 2 protein [Pseudanabaena sp. FACHB-1277]|uniref:Glycosyltransferase family 2 protein n=1 Tax=Pseudanabaena cinerea FACHB-1277 TaxID=2949581 RepID=A0A926UQH5_9CYAN|nr:glycosyltransferase [Pseudanabaena cinerea]MBD2148873.1 glycosyltransferase family 2 protein [Pseudanabaena cinerea FACHB-1277]